MKVVSNVARYLMALIFIVFGLNGFLSFLPAGPIPPLAGQFVGALVQSHYMTVVFILEIASGVLLLVNRYVPFALTLLAPVIVNILLFHVFMAPAGMPLAVLVALLWIVLASRVHYAFSGLFQQSGGEASARSHRHPAAAFNA